MADLPAQGDMRRTAVQTAVTGMRQVVGIGVSLLSVVVIARTLGPQGQGVYTLVLLLPTLVFTLASLGIGTATAYHVAAGLHSARDAYDGGVALSLRMMAVAYLATWALIALRELLPGRPFGDVPSGLLFLGSLPIGVWFVQMVADAVLLGSGRFKAYNAVTLASQLAVLAGLVVGLIVLRGGIGGALVGTVIGQLAGAAASVLTAIGELPPGRGRAWLTPNPGYRSAALRYGMRAHVANLLGFLNYRADVLLVGLLAGPIHVGLYAIAYGLAERIWLVSQAASTVLLPRISSLAADEAYRRVLTPTVARHTFAIGALAAIILFALTPPLVPLVFGADYAGAVGPLQLLLPGVAFFNVSRVLAADLAGRGRPGLNSLLDAASLALNFGLNLLLIPRFGAGGAAIAASASYAANTALRVAVYCRIAGVAWPETLMLTGADVARLARVARRG